ncbi:Uncharacterised protein [Sphingobacterium thalpophilum]|uniref:DUF8192 domain-containing protein n=1 Tax=Sphingobacterium thalpophilum TaxID=259 RepID=A0A4U9U9S6_9SPHI|nr:Uncharacterised protein [Sphingobacterium thalpophilum]
MYGQNRDFNDNQKNILRQLDTMGIDCSQLLTSHESTYFNLVFKKSRQDLDFTNKKVAFMTGSNGRTLSNKIDYFRSEKDRITRNQTPNNSTLCIFDKEQKKRSGGYDAAIVYWSKVLVPIDELISRLRGKNDLEQTTIFDLIYIFQLPIENF